MSFTAAGSSSLDVPQRQSPWAVLFLAIRTIRAVGVVQLAVAAGFVLAQSPPIILLLVLVPLIGLVVLGFAALAWWRYTFAIIDGELLVTKGILAQERLVVPLERIQSVSIEQKLLHRPIGLVQVSVDTAGTAQTEFTIDAIPRATAMELQRAAADNRASVPAPMAPGSPPPIEPGSTDVVVLQHDARRLVKMALTQLPVAGLAVFAPLFAVGDELFGALPFDAPEIDGSELGLWLVWAIPLGIAAVVIVLLLVNLIRVVVTEWGLTLTATSAGLRRDAGLLARTSKASSIPRIQRVSTRQGLLQRLVGLQNISLNTVGTGSIILPGCDADQVLDVRRRVLGDSAVQHGLPRRTSAAETFKAVRNTSVLCVLLVAGTVAFVSWWFFAVLFFVPFVWLTSRRSVRLRRWDIAEDSVFDHREFISWTRHEMLLRKVNGVVVRQSLFERSRDLATVILQTAEGAITIGMIPIEDARAVRDRALFSAETDRRAWM